MLACPNCGSDRLIPLTFTIATVNERDEPSRRPVAKCAACGNRIYALVKEQRSDAPE